MEVKMKKELFILFIIVSGVQSAQQVSFAQAQSLINGPARARLDHALDLIEQECINNEEALIWNDLTQGKVRITRLDPNIRSLRERTILFNTYRSLHKERFLDAMSEDVNKINHLLNQIDVFIGYGQTPHLIYHYQQSILVNLLRHYIYIMELKNTYEQNYGPMQMIVNQQPDEPQAKRARQD
ncbi:MAG: hypothetical protein ACJAZS_000536 [Alteromonas naphthalenivorans]|jgi:hypothetical protein